MNYSRFIFYIFYFTLPTFFGWGDFLEDVYMTVAGSTAGLLGAHEHRFMTKIFGKSTLRAPSIWFGFDFCRRVHVQSLVPTIQSSICSCSSTLPHDHLLLGSAPNIELLISRWELEKFKNCWSKSFRTSKILTLLYQQFSNLLISQRDMNGPRLRAQSNNGWSGGIPPILRNNPWNNTFLLFGTAN
jgi:hypothetical protein